MQRNVKSRKETGDVSAKSTSKSGRTMKRRTKRTPGRRSESMITSFVTLMMLLICAAFAYQFFVLRDNADSVGETTSKLHEAAAKQTRKWASKIGGSVRARALDHQRKAVPQPVAPQSVAPQQVIVSGIVDNGGPPHLSPHVPILPIFSPIPNAEALIEQVMQGNPTIAGVIALLQRYMSELHDENMSLASRRAPGDEILNSFYKLTKKHLEAFDKVYRNKPIFPIRKDESVFLSLAAFREHLLSDTLQFAFDNAKNPDQLFVGAIVQNCFGKVNPDGSIDPSGLPCKTGRQVIGKNAKGVDQTKVSDAPPDKNGIEDFCNNEKYKKYCDSGQIRVVYVHETESLGPAMARYYASKLWGGESYYVQTDSHLQFAVHWDQKYIDEFKAAKSYPKVVLSSYPPGFNPSAGMSVHESPGARLCFCETRMDDPNPVIRINTGNGYKGDEPRPTQIPFVAAGFFFTAAEWLIDVPFDPFIPWCFMGEEIALSLRSWTRGWDIYAPRKNLIAHQYRPGRMGLPKFWGTVGRLYGRPGMNNKLQGSVIMRIKNMVGYPDATLDLIRQQNLEFVLEDIEHYSTGTLRSVDAFMELAGITVDRATNSLQCHKIPWCNQGLLE